MGRFFFLDQPQGSLKNNEWPFHTRWLEESSLLCHCILTAGTPLLEYTDQHLSRVAASTDQMKIFQHSHLTEVDRLAFVEQE